MHTRRRIAALCLLPALWCPLEGQPSVPLPQEQVDAGELQSSVSTDLQWDQTLAEHLYNRAGFGARGAQLERAVQMGQAAAVEELLQGREPDYDPFFVSIFKLKPKGLSERELDAAKRTYRRRNRAQTVDFSGWWVDQMMANEHPLRERMTLFWHGHFASSLRSVRSSAYMIRQNELFRRRGLEDFRELLRSVLRDPAMLVYLDAVKSKKDNPNENLGRELLELFTLGEGNYSEADVKAAARALTGWDSRAGKLKFSRKKHDDGPKQFLGQEGSFDANDLVRILLEQNQCARHLALQLITYFEGVQPKPKRLERYAELLLEQEYDLRAFLRTLFMDPDFYRKGVLGNRVASPIDFLVGSLRRMRADVSGEVVYEAAALLGEKLLEPPSVAGWEGGLAWVSTSNLQTRGNLIGLLLSVVNMDDLAQAPEESKSGAEEFGDDSHLGGMDSGMDPGMDVGPTRSKKRRVSDGLAALRKLHLRDWSPRVFLTTQLERQGLSKEREIATAMLDDLLAVEASKQSTKSVVQFLKGERKRLEWKAKDVLTHGYQSEMLLRRTAHLILSLPEAHLH